MCLCCTIWPDNGIVFCLKQLSCQQRSSHFLHYKVTYSCTAWVTSATHIFSDPYHLRSLHSIDLPTREKKKKKSTGFLGLFRRRKKKPEMVRHVSLWKILPLLECRFSKTWSACHQNVHFPLRRKLAWVPQFLLVSANKWELVWMGRLFPLLTPWQQICRRRDLLPSRPWVHHRASPTTSAPVI